MQRVALDGGAVKRELAQPRGLPRDVDVERPLDGGKRRDGMVVRTDRAHARHDRRDLGDGASADERLEQPESLEDVELHALDAAAVQDDGNATVPFNPREVID